MTNTEHTELLQRVDVLEAQVKRLTRAIQLAAIVVDVNEPAGNVAAA